MAELTLEIATPERLLFQDQVSEAEVPGREGYIGILPGHAPLISELAAGVLRYVKGGATVYVTVLGGFVEILDDHVRVLADSAMRKEEIDLGQARNDLKRAQELMSNPSDIDPAQALENAQKAQAQIDTAAR
ncbi:MAG: ATP synthase F1 subunit epsilon [Acidobacteriota bacterium]|nr:ATP synthase F1 subunit epsilon [Acidobacteriota bacterium]